MPGYEALQWYGLMAPVGTPREIVSKLYKGVGAALKNNTVKERFLSSGAKPVGNSPEEFTRLVKSEIVQWAKVVKAAGLQPK